MADKICSSADKVLEVFLENAPMDTSHHRMVKQQNKCGYGLQGVCCRLCSNGPCRLSPSKPKGVCGADADTIACRNFLRQVAAGSGCYTHVVENTARRLKELAQELQAEGKKPKYKDSVAKLAKILQINCCGNCGPDCHNSCAKTAEMIADAVLADIRKPYDEKMTLMKNIALPKRYELWEKLGILPGGAKDEIFNAVVKTSTNLNSDPMDMLLQCLRLGISTGNYGLILTNLMNDIIMGPPQISMDPVGFRIIDPEYINIMITGHQQSMFADLEEKLESEIVQKSAELVGDIIMGPPQISMDPVGFRIIDPEYINIMITGHQQSMFADLEEKLESEIVQKSAQLVGAKGIRIVGCTCVGQDYQARSGCYKDVYCGHAGNKGIRIVGCTCVGQDYQARSGCYKDVYCGHAGNNYTSEAVLMTGCVDLVVSEFNCTIPGIEPICEQLDIKMLCLDDVAKKANAELLPYTAEEKEKITSQIIADALCGFKNRKEKLYGTAPAKGEKRVNVMAQHGFDKSQKKKKRLQVRLSQMLYVDLKTEKKNYMEPLRQKEKSVSMSWHSMVLTNLLPVYQKIL
ncbi:carbon-monoxide dehydrogenase catalytic subunit [Anaerobutyricum hallii CAG:12]|nr:carbon-monoxide dehydrogenase catalytic subunit [Anaerobutyricum hallii CAG:12]